MLRRELPPCYADLSLLGQGGGGSVVAATDARSGRRVAIKALDAGVRADRAVLRRFYREVVAVANMAHPSIPRILEIRKGALPYYVMEYVPGTPLDCRLRESGPLAPAAALDVAAALASALACAHARGVIHRDVKPQNVVVTPEGRAVLLDFGVAHLGDASGVTPSGQAMGTPHYMAPEQLRGEAVDARADVYALGLTLFELLAGRRPFGERPPFARLASDPEDLAVARPGLDPRLVAVVRRCLAREPADRFKDGGELGAALDALRTPPQTPSAVAEPHP